LLGIGEPPLWARATRYVKAMPQYHVGHMARVETIERTLARHPGLALAGGAYRGVGIADCVRAGEDAAVRMLEGEGGGESRRRGRPSSRRGGRWTSRTASR